MSSESETPEPVEVPAPVPAVVDDPAETGFHLYAGSGGDIHTVARFMRVPVDMVRGWKASGKWDARVRKLAAAGVGSELIDSDFETAQKALNRGVNYVQAHNLRTLCDRMLLEFTGKDNLEDAFRVTTESGSRLDLKPLSDLANAMRIAHTLTSNALGDEWAAGRRPTGRPKGGSRAAMDVRAAMEAARDRPRATAAEIALGQTEEPA